MCATLIINFPRSLRPVITVTAVHSQARQELRLPAVRPPPSSLCHILAHFTLHIAHCKFKIQYTPLVIHPILLPELLIVNQPNCTALITEYCVPQSDPGLTRVGCYLFVDWTVCSAYNAQIYYPVLTIQILFCSVGVTLVKNHSDVNLALVMTWGAYFNLEGGSSQGQMCDCKWQTRVRRLKSLKSQKCIRGK